MYKIAQLLFLTLLLCGCSALHKTDSLASELHPIPLELTTHLGDQQQFIEGDEIQFLLSLGSDAYIYMVYLDAKNNITQILPNKNQPGNFYSAGYFLTIPEYVNGYRFIISQPFGDESVWVFASDQLITQSSLENNIASSIEGYKKELQKRSKKAYGEYELRIVTKKK